MLSRYFIDRPIFASVLSILITLAGGIAVFALPVAMFPPIAPPMVQVSCAYPGANAKVVADTVAAPIEQVVNGVDHLMYMQSQSTNDGDYVLFLTFDVGADLNIALVQVQNRVQLAMPLLPSQVQKQGVNIKKKSPDILLAVSFTSPDGRYDDIYMSNYATIQVKDELLRCYGVGDVTYLGERDYSIRAWLDPDQLATRNLTANDVAQAIQKQNQQVICGFVGQSPTPGNQPLQIPLTAKGRLLDPKEFGDIVVKTGQTGNSASTPVVPVVHLRDVARIELGAQQYDQISTLDGQSSVSLAVFQVPGSNAIDVAADVRKKMNELSKRFPAGLEYQIVYDTTPFISESIRGVVDTLRDAIILVAIVVLVFLQKWRAVLIPLIAVPVAIIGTFAAMAAVGFSLNNLSLFGLVLAIGIVVDDAIVVVENVERWLDKGLPPREAAVKAMEEVTGPVIGVALVLCAVFIPCAFITGLIGLFFRQFALTIAISTVISAFNSLTLSPALAAILLQPHGARRDPLTWLLDMTLGWFFKLFDWVFALSTRLYTGIVGVMLRGSLIVLLVYAGMLVLTYKGFTSWPVGFVPIQDQGYLILVAQLPDSASVQRTQEVIARIDKIARGDPKDPEHFPGVPGVAHTLTIAGQSLQFNANSPNWGSMFIILKEFKDRKEKSEQSLPILFELRRRCAIEVPEADIGVFPAPPVHGLGAAGGFKLYVEDRGSLGLSALQEYTDDLAAKVKSPRIPAVNSAFRANTPQLYLDIDRVKVRTLQVDFKDVFDTLQIYMGALYVNNFNSFGRYWQVQVMAEPNVRNRLEKMLRLEVKNKKGEMIPLASLMTVREIGGPVMVMRFNLYEAAPIAGMQSPAASTGEVIDIFKEDAREVLPDAMTYEWSEIVYLQIVAGNTAMKLFGLGVVLVFLVLAALYESWSLPLAVILVVPMCLLCSLAGLMIAFLPIDILAQVGLMVLVGLASKNAILIVEFAKQQREEGVDRRKATLEACRLRLRPIMMTSFAFILGVVPLVLAKGAGAEMRHSLGTAVFSGMLGVTFFGIFLTPVFFYRLTGIGEDLRATTMRELRIWGRVLLYLGTAVTFGIMAPRFLHGTRLFSHHAQLLPTTGIWSREWFRQGLEFMLFGILGVVFIWIITNLSFLMRHRLKPAVPRPTPVVPPPSAPHGESAS